MRAMPFRTVPLLAVLMFQLVVNPRLLAVGWSDNFNDGSVTDGNPVTWSQDLLGFFPGNYDASSGDYSLSGAVTGQMVTWVDGVSFTDSYIRTQGVVLPGTEPTEVDGNLAILGRLDTNTVSAYVLYVDTTGGTLGLQISLGGTLTDIAPPVELGTFDARSDIIIELDIVGNQLSGYAWQPGNPKPAAPQIMATDSTLPAGPAGIAYDEDDDNTTGLFRFVTAQDTPIIDEFGVLGDYNGNGTVDAADYVLWRGGTSLQNEVVTPGSITPEDYDAWRARFGNTSGSGLGSGGAVPEPTVVVLATVWLVAWLSLGVRRPS
jgi:hypothetical protein